MEKQLSLMRDWNLELKSKISAHSLMFFSSHIHFTLLGLYVVKTKLSRQICVCSLFRAPGLTIGVS